MRAVWIGITSATVPVRPRRRLRPDWLAEYPSEAAVSSTSLRVASLTSPRAFMARDTVAIDMPSSRATSLMPTARPDFPPVRTSATG